MKSKSTVMTLVLLSALMLATFNGVPVVSQEVEPVPCPSGLYEKYGPRIDRLIYKVAGDVQREWDDFEAGKIDVLDWAAPADKWQDWIDDPTITMGKFEEFAPIYLALNTMRWPLGHGDQLPEGWTSYPTNYISNHKLSLWSGDPSSDLPVGTSDKTWIDYECQRCLDARQFRRGLAHMVDRAAQVAYMKQAGQALEPSLFWPSMKSWEAPGLPTYAYDLALAAAAFEAGGFKNWDADADMEYSPGHNGVVVEELPVLQIYTRADDDHRINAGKLLSWDMGLLGIPHSLIIATYGEVSSQVWANYDYDIYFEYWPWDPLPNFYSEWFRSGADIYPDPWGNNEHRFHSKEFDVQAEFFSNATSMDASRPYCNEMQRIIHRDVPAIPYYSYVGFNAHQTKYRTWSGEEKYSGKLWQGMCNFPGEGFYTYTGSWTPLNAHPEGFEKGGTLRHGLNIDAEMLDVMDAIYFYDGIILQLIYEQLLTFNPWDMSRFEPWLCESYNVSSWTRPTLGTATAINFTLIPGILWQDGQPMTAEDVGFSFWFTRETKSVNYMYAEFFDSYKIYPNTWWNGTYEPGRETIELRFKKQTWEAEFWCSALSIIPKHVWEPVGVKGSAGYIPEDHDTVFGTGPFRFYKDNVVGRVDRVPGQYIYLEPNPLYFRKFVWPDVCGVSHNPGERDGEVDIVDDFFQVSLPGIIFARENTDGTWNDPPGDWGPYCDVNQDGRIGVGDLMEIGTHFKQPWPPAWFNWTYQPSP